MIANYEIKLKLYKKLAEHLSDAGSYSEALVCLKKMLRLAWKLRDEDSEIEIYDLLGKVLMLIGEIELSYFFHHKSMSNDREPITSTLRIFGNSNISPID